MFKRDLIGLSLVFLFFVWALDEVHSEESIEFCSQFDWEFFLCNECCQYFGYSCDLDPATDKCKCTSPKPGEGRSTERWDIFENRIRELNKAPDVQIGDKLRELRGGGDGGAAQGIGSHSATRGTTSSRR